MPITIGLDIGTSGVRAVAARETGEVVQAASAGLPPTVSRRPGWMEQDPLDWWSATEVVLRALAEGLGDEEPVVALAVDSTSGTILAVDDAGAPLTPALMYNDKRAETEAEELNSAGADLCASMGYRFNASFAASRILWLRRQQPDIYDKTRYFLHAADFVAARLGGEFGVTDRSNVLKTGYDLVNNRWPDFLKDSGLGLDVHKLPRVVKSGATIGILPPALAADLGLPRGIRIVAGASDGTAGFLASGAVEPGEFNTTLGTTLVVKGVSRNILRDPKGRIYSHAHPSGYWLPGGASNVGGECLSVIFPQRDLAKLDEAALRYLPSRHLVYPLVRRGERFPFVDPEAEGFETGTYTAEAERYAAWLEGVALVERWIYDLLTDLGALVRDRIYSTGGGSRSAVWSQLRASILGRCVLRPKESEPAFGMAVLAASEAMFAGNLEAATRNMVRIRDRFEPSVEGRRAWDEKYERFRSTCAERGYE